MNRCPPTHGRFYRPTAQLTTSIATHRRTYSCDLSNRSSSRTTNKVNSLTSSLSQPTMSPYDTSLHMQYRGSLGSGCHADATLSSVTISKDSSGGTSSGATGAIVCCCCCCCTATACCWLAARTPDLIEHNERKNKQLENLYSGAAKEPPSSDDQSERRAIVPVDLEVRLVSAVDPSFFDFLRQFVRKLVIGSNPSTFSTVDHPNRHSPLRK